MPVDSQASARDKRVALGALLFMVVGIAVVILIYRFVNIHPAPPVTH
jgi:hypothetical protein